MHREVTSLSSAERSQIKHLLAQSSTFKAGLPSDQSPEEFVLRRVKGYNWVNGAVLINMPTKDQKDEPWIIPVSEEEGRYWGWHSPAENHARNRSHMTAR